MTTAPSPKTSQPRRVILAAALCGLLFVLPISMPLTPDVPAYSPLVDMIAAAKDCAEGRGCDLKLTPSSPHGAGFVHYLALVFRLGGSVFDAQIAAVVLLALAFGLLVLAASRFYGEAVGYGLLPLSYLASLVGLHFGAPKVDIFENSSLIPLSSLLFCAGACGYLATTRLRYIAIAALGASLGPYFHLAAGALVVALAVLVLMTPRRDRTAAAMIVGLVVVAVNQLSSATIVLDHAQWLWGPTGGGPDHARFAGGVMPIIARCLPPLVLMVAVLICIRAPGAPLSRRSSLFFLITHLPFYLLLTVLDVAHSEQSRYGLALSPGLSLLLALTLQRLGRMIAAGRPFSRPLQAQWFERARRLTPRAAVVALAAAALFQVHLFVSDRRAEGAGPCPDEPTIPLTLHDIRAIATHLGEKGWTLHDVAERLQGNDKIRAGPIREALAMSERLLADHQGGGESAKDLEVIVAHPEDLPASQPDGFEIVRERRETVVAVRRYTPSIRWSEFVACNFFPKREQDGCRCKLVRREARYDSHPQDRGRLSSKLFLRVAVQDDRADSSPQYLLVRAPIKAGRDTGPRDLTLPAKTAAYPCAGAFLAATGIGDGNAFPATRLALREGDTSKDGELTVAWELHSTSCRSTETPLPLPTVVDREPGALTIATCAPPHSFQDPRLMADMLACVNGPAAAEASLESRKSARHPEPLLPGRHVALWGVLLAFTLASLAPIRAPWCSALLARAHRRRL